MGALDRLHIKQSIALMVESKCLRLHLRSSYKQSDRMGGFGANQAITPADPPVDYARRGCGFGRAGVSVPR